MDVPVRVPFRHRERTAQVPERIESPPPAWPDSLPSPAGATAARVATGARSRAGRGRRVLHVLVGIGAWAAFAGLWIWQLNVSVPTDWPQALLSIFALLAVYAVLVPAWVHWNRSIYRRRHRRTEPLEIDVDFEHDMLGRRIALGPELALGPAEIAVTVSADGATKIYRAADL